MAASHRAWSYAAVATAALLWGFGFVFGKLAFSSMPVDAHVSYRFIIASICVLPIVLLRRIKITKRDWMIFAIAGFAYVPFQFLLQFDGLSKTSLSHAALMIATAPVMIGLASIFFSKRGSRPHWIAIAFAVIGTILIVSRPSGHATILGDVLVLFSLLGAVVWVLMSERITDRHDPTASSSVIMLIGAAMLIAYEAIVHPHDLIAAYSTQAWIATICAGVLCTALTTVLWNIGLKRIPGSDAAVFATAEPLVGTTCGVLLFGDHLTPATILGGLLVIGGTILVTRRGLRKTSTPVERAA